MWCQFEIETDGGILGRISPFVAMSLVKQMTPYHNKETISCQSGANVVLTRESPDGTYCAYFPFGLSTEVPQ